VRFLEIMIEKSVMISTPVRYVKGVANFKAIAI